ncbi:hypothetical protein D9Q98_000048 [Chlorella vulgaris]|uniref:Uncharacterized protein n=1 Tax=Chlorella vulgaris TaxID=3077 RepID=A0A9D4TXN5_CHLVU|nr:hypothetical protein D9Q98_000048 [Chlorella vulgaris]
MASSSRPKRQRRQPERLGTFASQRGDWEEEHSQEEQETSTSDAESEPQPQRRGRHKRAPGAPANGGDESEEDSQLGGSGPEADSESENEDAAPSRVQRKPTKPTMKPVRVAASSGGVNSVRQCAVAGAQPLPASSFLSIVHACPNLMERLLSPDALRTVTLIAQDTANLSIALGASSKVAADWWRALAAKHAPAGAAIDADTPSREALAVVQQAVRADVARAQSCTKSDAKATYRLTDKDLSALPFVERPNRLFGHLAPRTKLYSVLALRAAAHKRWGSMEGMDAARQKARSAADSAKATLSRREGERTDEMRVALEQAGLDPSQSKLLRRKDVQGFCKRGVGSAAAIAAHIVADNQAKQSTKQRRAQLHAVLASAGLAEYLCGKQARDFVEGHSSATAEAVLASVKRTADERQRSTTIYALLRAQQLQGFEGKASVKDWIESGSGTAEQVVADLAAQRDAVAAQQARCTRFCELLEAERISRHFRYTVPACREYIHNNTGSEAAALAAVRAAHEEAEAQQRARHERSACIADLLTAEQLPLECTVLVKEVCR